MPFFPINALALSKSIIARFSDRLLLIDFPLSSHGIPKIIQQSSQKLIPEGT
jgi:hypothetical protein